MSRRLHKQSRIKTRSHKRSRIKTRSHKRSRRSNKRSSKRNHMRSHKRSRRSHKRKHKKDGFSPLEIISGIALGSGLILANQFMRQDNIKKIEEANEKIQQIIETKTEAVNPEFKSTLVKNINDQIEYLSKNSVDTSEYKNRLNEILSQPPLQIENLEALNTKLTTVVSDDLIVKIKKYQNDIDIMTNFLQSKLDGEEWATTVDLKTQNLTELENMLKNLENKFKDTKDAFENKIRDQLGDMSENIRNLYPSIITSDIIELNKETDILKKINKLNDIKVKFKQIISLPPPPDSPPPVRKPIVLEPVQLKTTKDIPKDVNKSVVKNDIQSSLKDVIAQKMKNRNQKVAPIEDNNFE